MSELFALAWHHLPTLIAIVAIIDIIRSRSPWYWILIVWFIPYLGVIAYWLAVRSPWAPGRVSARGATPGKDKAGARLRLEELENKLSHWRGPSVLAEAGEELLTLGREEQAAAYFQEAKDAGSPPEESNLGLATALERLGRPAEAIAPLRELCEAKPDYKYGAADLALARCLDETGSHDEAEPVLRSILERRQVVEAQVRLARLLLKRGETDEASRILAEVESEAKTMPAFARRQQAAWIRAATRLKSGGDALPSQRAAEATPAAAWTKSQTAGVIMLVVLVAGWAACRVLPDFFSDDAAEGVFEERVDLGAELERHDQMRPRDARELASWDLTGAELEALVATRRALVEPLAGLVSARERFEREAGFVGEEAGVSELLQWGAELREVAVAQGVAENRVLRALLGQLRAHDLSRRRLRDLIAVVDWRWARHEDATPYGLPEFLIEDWERARAKHGDAERKAFQLAAMVERAAEDTSLSQATTALLEGRRAELMRLDPIGLDELLTLLRE